MAFQFYFDFLIFELLKSPERHLLINNEFVGVENNSTLGTALAALQLLH